MGLCSNCSQTSRQRSNKVRRNSRLPRKTCRRLPWNCSMRCSPLGGGGVGRRGAVVEEGGGSLGAPRWGCGVAWAGEADGMSAGAAPGTTEGGIGLGKMKCGEAIRD